MEYREQKGWMIVTLVCAVLIVAAAAIITVLAVSGSGQASGGSGQAGSVWLQYNQGDHPAGGETVATTPSTNDKSGGGDKSGGSNPPNNNPNPSDLTIQPILPTSPKDLTIQPIPPTSPKDLTIQPIPATSLDEALLNQAEWDFLKALGANPSDFDITETKISQIDPDWGSVRTRNKNTGKESTQYFHKNGGKWAPPTAQDGNKPNDI
jgi:hypothetical protein